MTNTLFDTPHGMMNSINVSTAHEMCLLAHHCLQNELFLEIVGTERYTCKGQLGRTYQWVNTNKLLGGDSEDGIPRFEGTIGCKTGVTSTAGPCFAGAFKRKMLESSS